MKPVFQDKTNDTFPHGGGNCLQAVVASIMELPLEAVPHFMLYGPKWVDAFRLFLEAKGYERTYYRWGTPPRDGKYRIMILQEEGMDYSHAVVGLGDKIVHDPRGDGDSNTPIEGWYDIEKY